MFLEGYVPFQRMSHGAFLCKIFRFQSEIGTGVVSTVSRFNAVIVLRENDVVLLENK